MRSNHLSYRPRAGAKTRRAGAQGAKRGRPWLAAKDRRRGFAAAQLRHHFPTAMKATKKISEMKGHEDGGNVL